MVETGSHAGAGDPGAGLAGHRRGRGAAADPRPRPEARPGDLSGDHQRQDRRAVRRRRRGRRGLRRRRPDAQAAALRAYGHNLGLAFQLADDALDYGGATETLGKNAGDDFREGKATLPLLLAIARSGPREADFWERAIGRKEQTDADFRRARELIVGVGALEATLDLAADYAETAKAALGGLPARATGARRWSPWPTSPSAGGLRLRNRRTPRRVRRGSRTRSRADCRQIARGLEPRSPQLQRQTRCRSHSGIQPRRWSSV